MQAGATFACNFGSLGLRDTSWGTESCREKREALPSAIDS